jgi:glyoxylase-like metal-dependent hydrolase (beta-lactamase superfamily II)
MGIELEPYEANKAAKLLICCTCGTQFPTTDREALKTCYICDDERQYVPSSGQAFTTLEEVQKSHRNEFKTYEKDSRLTFIQTTPKFAIGQRPVLIKTPHGNVLWDCITLLDQETIDHIEKAGGLKAIVISHPHFYTTHIQWARAFRCPVYLSSEDMSWTALKSNHQVALTTTETDIEGTGVKAIKLGGHFPGSLVSIFDGRMFHADTLVTTPAGLGNWAPRERPKNATTFAYMWSIPNMIPLSAEEVTRMWKTLKPYEFHATHGMFDGFDIEDVNIKKRVLDSMKIQVEHMGHQQHALLSESL